ncbi:hypothetical protein HYQ46_008621 [Verticillium longisporum]|nr:hypothetical protein HYQ46_008621 [Verticillium longisporum]
MGGGKAEGDQTGLWLVELGFFFQVPRLIREILCKWDQVLDENGKSPHDQQLAQNLAATGPLCETETAQVRSEPF